MSNISVAVLYPSNRIDRIIKPLEKSNLNVELEPDNPFTFDFIFMDIAGTHIYQPFLLRKLKNSDTKIIYRIRGDMFRAYREMNLTYFKYILFQNLTEQLLLNIY